MSFNNKLAERLGLSESEISVLEKLDTPIKIQDFVNNIPANFEKAGETIHSPRSVLRENKAHCIEGALLACLAFWLHGQRPLLIDMKVSHDDFEHVIAPFKINGLWGAISKSNHAPLRYRDPIYKNTRELIISFFHEYSAPDGTKTLREYTMPVSIKKFAFNKKWVTDENSLWWLSTYLNTVKHKKILPKNFQTDALRKADKIEKSTREMPQWDKSGKQIN